MASLHRLLVCARERSWITSARALKLLVTLMDRGWSWISFPTSMLQTTLRQPERQCWPTIDTLLRQAHKADLVIALQALIALLAEIDRGQYPRLSTTRLAVITPSMSGGFAQGVVACVGKKALGKKQNGPYLRYPHISYGRISDLQPPRVDRSARMAQSSR